MDGILEGKRILVVDDEPDILDTLKELLDMCLIDTAPNFETAQKFLKRGSYDAAILDIMGVKGYDLLELAKEKNIPCLMLTAHALSPDNLVKSLKKGAQSYIPKDQMADIGTYLAEIIQARKKGIRKPKKWLERLAPFFEKRFGPEWKAEHKEFWREYDRVKPITKREVEDML
jgi:DNA-binding NtrC family response regulator